MAKATSNGLELEYEIIGDDDGVPLLAIMGLGFQLVHWDEELCEAFADRGFRVIRYDNRDAGLSTKLEPGAAYTVADMADDAAGLLDFLTIDAAHVVGASMGGMIAQELAIRHRKRVLTLTSIMSTTGAEGYGAPTAEAMEALMTPAPTEREANLDHAVRIARVIVGDSEEFPFDEDRARRRAARAFDRAFYPQGMANHVMAVLLSPDRTPQLRELDIPALVIHGANDPLIQPDGGEVTAAAIPNAEHLVIEGMGHALPPMAWPQVVQAVTALAARVGAEA